MAELATLGIEAKAQGVDEAAAKLDKLSGAAKRAEAAVEGIGPSSSKAGQMAARAANETATALNAEAAAATKAAGAMRVHAQAANQNIRGMQGAAGHVGNLAAQFQDIGVSAAMSMSPLQIALQQGTQISAVLGPMGAAGAVKALGEAFLSVISPVSLATIAIVALVAAGLQMVDWPKLAASALNGLASVLQEIAPYAVAAAAALALLYAPAIIGGIVQLIALLGRLSVAAVSLAATFAAANPATAFVLGITAAVAAANIFRDELQQIFGRDIVADAKNAVNFIIGAFVGGYQGIKAAWSALPTALGDIVMSTANAVITGVENMINNVTSAINGYIQSINGMLQSLPFGVGEGVSIGSIGSVSLGRVNNPYAGAADSAQSAIGDAVSGAMGTDYVGGFVDAVSRGASAASAKLKELAGSFTEVEGAAGKAGKAAGGAAKEAKDPWEGLRGAVDRTKEALNFAKDATKGFLSHLRSGLQNGEGFWKSFGNAAMNVLNKIIDKVETQLVDALFSAGSAASGATGGGGGIFGAILGGIGKIFGFAKGGYTGNGAAHQAAGIVHGKEYVFSARATSRIGVGNLERMHRAANGYQSGGYVAPAVPSTSQQGGVIVVRTVNEVRNGNLVPVMTEVAGEVSGQKIREASPQIVAASVTEANRTAPAAVAKYQSQKSGGDYRLG